MLINFKKAYEIKLTMIWEEDIRSSVKSLHEPAFNFFILFIFFLYEELKERGYKTYFIIVFHAATLNQEHKEFYAFSLSWIFLAIRNFKES